jgi:Flp pilus assembly protein TadG
MAHRSRASQQEFMMHIARRRNRFGAQAVEFALVFPVFVLFVFGLVEIGRGMMVSTLMSNAARAGCRSGVVVGASTSTVDNRVDGLLKAQGINGYTTTVQVNGNAATDVSAAQPKDTVTVMVSVPVSNVSWLPGASYVFGNITGRFSMPHE